MVESITVLMIGFTVLASAILLFAYVFFLPGLQKTRTGLLACAVLLVALAGLQLQHRWYLMSGADLLGNTSYVTLLLLTPPAFYFFSREILLPGRSLSVWMLAHFGPLLLSFALPIDIVAPLAFLIGTGYAFWFTTVVYGMRDQRRRFRFEIFFFGLFAVLALMVLILGFAMPYIDAGTFYVSYANFIGIAFVLIVASLIIFPEILTDISDAATMSYATTTLKEVDVDAALERLESVMARDKVFQNENLNLSLLAEAVGLNSHQLSELINTRFDMGFSRYVRERRVAEARRLLHEDPSASILSISMTTGFRSQSNFYAAFREIVGESPGSYRKKGGKRSADS